MEWKIRDVNASGSIPVRSAHAQWPASGGVPEHAISSGTLDREDIHAVVKGLRQNLQLSVTVQIGNGWGGWCAVAVAVVAGIGKGDIMQ